MKKNYELPESEELHMQVERNFLQTGGAGGEVPDIPGGEE